MHFTPNRLASLLVPVALVALAALAACGQVTGLSNDYEFDLVEGGAGDGGSAGDGSKSDAPSDATSGDAADATKTCTTAESATAFMRLNTYSGTTTCKTCLAPSCCTDVDACFHDTDCSRVLGCKLDCTTKNSAERQQCFKGCGTSGSGVPDLFTNGIGACSASACRSQCAFQ
jgi:hypothetical protein